jgi:putative nucleotide binding protein
MEDYAHVLDFLPSGRPDDRNRRGAVAYAVGKDDFVLLELKPRDDASLLVGDRVYVGRDDEERDEIEHVRGRIAFEDMTHNAQNELPFVLEEIVEANEDRFLAVYNEGGAISTRMHVLELLPGLGKKLMKKVLEERREQEFESFEDLDDRVPSLHNPQKVIAKRIETEINDPTEKYHLFARPPEDADRR